MAFPNDTDPELIAKSAAITQAYTPEVHAYLLSLFPTPEEAQRNHVNYAASYAASLAGDADKIKECENYRSAVNEGLAILIGVAKAVAIKDPKVPETLGLSAIASKTTHPDTTLTKPTGFKVFYTPDGQIVSSLNKVSFAQGYQVWGCDDDPNIETNWRLIAASPTCRGIVLPGLHRAKNNWLKVRAVRGKGVVGPWSNIVNLSPS